MTTIEVLEERMERIEKQNTKEHAEIMAKLDRIFVRFDTLPEKFPTRVEYDSTAEMFDNRIKTVEGVLKGGAGAIGLAILGALLKLILI